MDAKTFPASLYSHITSKAFEEKLKRHSFIEQYSSCFDFSRFANSTWQRHKSRIPSAQMNWSQRKAVVSWCTCKSYWCICTRLLFERDRVSLHTCTHLGIFWISWNSCSAFFKVRPPCFSNKIYSLDNTSERNLYIFAPSISLRRTMFRVK